MEEWQVQGVELGVATDIQVEVVASARLRSVNVQWKLGNQELACTSDAILGTCGLYIGLVLSCFQGGGGSYNSLRLVSGYISLNKSGFKLWVSARMHLTAASVALVRAPQDRARISGALGASWLFSMRASSSSSSWFGGAAVCSPRSSNTDLETCKGIVEI